MLVAIAVFQTRLTSVVTALTTGADIFRSENAFSCVGPMADDFSRLNLSFMFKLMGAVWPFECEKKRKRVLYFLLCRYK